VTQSSLPAPNLDDARERVVERLSIHYARDQLTLDELESRLERVYAARTAEALDSVLAGLPALSPTSASITGPRAPKAPQSRNYFAVMSGVIRRGAWVVPKRINAVAFMGGVELDLREATLSSGVTEIEVLAVMGGVVVTVPPNVRLECDGFAFMGGFEDQLKQPASGDPSAPVVRLTGFAFMGGVEARVLPPGAPAPDEK
jgi:uncharacterized protein DUF1707/cell wall-active antibiotic response 4TMS protein YvqF